MFIVLFWGQGTSLHPIKGFGGSVTKSSEYVFCIPIGIGGSGGVAHGSIDNWAVAQTGLAVYVFACGKFCLIKIISWFSKE